MNNKRLQMYDGWSTTTIIHLCHQIPFFPKGQPIWIHRRQFLRYKKLTDAADVELSDTDKPSLRRNVSVVPGMPHVGEEVRKVANSICLWFWFLFFVFLNWMFFCLFFFQHLFVVPFFGCPDWMIGKPLTKGVSRNAGSGALSSKNHLMLRLR